MMVPLTPENIKVGDKIVLATLKGPTGPGLDYRSYKVGLKGIIAEIRPGYDYPIKVKWNEPYDNTRLGASWHRLCYFEKEDTLKKGDRVIFNHVKGSTVTRQRNGKLATVREDAAPGDSNVYVTWDDGFTSTTYPYIDNLTKVENVPATIKEVAAAYWAKNEELVAELLSPYKPTVLPVGSVFRAKELNMTWVVTEAGVMAMDLVTGTTTKSDLSLDAFAQYVKENGVMVSLA
jgi:hypothetical protein